jgi:adenylate cyclase
MNAANRRMRLSLFRKYFLALFTAVTLPLLANGVSEAWFGYHEQRAMIDKRLTLEAAAAAIKIESFLDSIRSQMGWVVQIAWSSDAEAHREDALRLLRQVPAMIELSLMDARGVERVRVSRIGEDVIDSRIDRSLDPAVLGVREARIWHGPVTLNRGSEPYMSIALAGNRSAAGSAVAQINLVFIWDVVSAIRIAESGLAFVLDDNSRLVAHPDISLVLKGTDIAKDTQLRALHDALRASNGLPVSTRDFQGERVIAAAAPVPGVDWLVVAEQSISEAYLPIRVALWRASLFLLGGTLFALALAYLLARRMWEPIRLLEAGADRIGAGDFESPIEIRTGDELERLANRFNLAAAELAISQERSERIARLKRFLPSPVADLVERSGEEALLDARRTDVVTIFCDLRGFTEFAARSEPEDVMHVLSDYYQAVGDIITRYEATLTQFSGDGVMALVNAPIPSPDDPLLRALRMSQEFQAAVQDRIPAWRIRGQTLGFGIGLAAGEATVGRVGYEGRHDYTAIGNVVNLAARLCATAEDGEILLDAQTAAPVREAVALRSLGTRWLKGYPVPVEVFAAFWKETGTL